MDYVSTGGISAIRLCDDSDAEFILQLFGNLDLEMSSKLSHGWDSIEKIEDDIFSGKHVWYCLETENDTVIVIARLSFQEDGIAKVDSLYFAKGLFSEEAAIGVLRSFLVQIETTAFHMNAAKIIVEAEDTQQKLHQMLEDGGYQDSAGYLMDGATTMVLSFHKALSDTSLVGDEAGFSIVTDPSDPVAAELAALMPGLFSALHKEYTS